MEGGVMTYTKHAHYTKAELVNFYIADLERDIQVTKEEANPDPGVVALMIRYEAEVKSLREAITDPDKLILLDRYGMPYIRSCREIVERWLP
jgi:hypothetical protein